MTRDEAIKVLAILKAAYPSSFRGMTKDEANGTISVWASQFSTVSVDIVIIAIHKLIGTSDFVPTISQVKQKLSTIYWEAYRMIENHKRATEYDDFLGGVDTSVNPLTEDKLEKAKAIMQMSEAFKYKQDLEPSVSDILDNYGSNLTLENKSNIKQLT